MEIRLYLLLALAAAWECGVTPGFSIEQQPTSQLRRRISERRLSIDYSRSTGEFSPIRIHVEYMDLGLSAALDTELKETVMPGVISWFQHALSVNPIVGKLKLDITTCSEISVPAAHRSVGVEADYILYVYGVGVAYPYVARAGACAYEAGARNAPVAGLLQLNTQNYGTNINFDTRVQVILHEVTHALGFTPSSWSKFLDTNGQPYGSYNVTVTARGLSRTKLTFPTVVAKVREYFGCEDLDGAELEDAGGTGTASSHWEKRIFGSEYMVGAIDSVDFSFSEITLALFADSGFYSVNYEYATPLLYGKGRGCSFHTEKCVVNGVAKFDEFCTVQQEGCDYNNLALGSCRIQTGLTIPAEEQYFSDTTMGSLDSLNDYCPVYIDYSNTKCKLTALTRSYRQPTAGPNSRCFDGTWGLKSATTSNVGTCHVVTCLESLAKVALDSTTSIDCPQAGGTIDLPSPYVGKFKCPSFDKLCVSVPCMSACLGRGKCVAGNCQCDAGYSGFRCEVKCNPQCLTCNSLDATKCLSCRTNALLSSGDCTCTAPMQWNALWACVSSACSKSCKSCSGSACQTCWANATLKNGACACDDKYFPNSDGSMCLPCFQSCRQCTGTGDYQCTACFDNASVYITGECVCNAGYYTDSYADACTQCDPTCATCNGAVSTNCTSCPANAMLAGGSTGPCGCVSGYIASGSTCAKCGSTCIECSITKCSSCAASAEVKIDVCECKEGYSPSPDVLNCAKTCHPTCSTCTSTAANQCTACFANAKSSGTFPSTCVCSDGYYPNPNAANCKSCSRLCKTCTSFSSFACTSCPGTNILLEFGLICSTTCPYTYTNDGTSCQVRAGKVADFLFGSYTNYPIDSVNGLVAFSGPGDSFYPLADIGDPVPAPNAGLHFDGESDYLTLPPNSNDTTSVMLASTHYIELWARPDTSSGKRQCLLAKSQYGNWNLHFCISPASALTLEILFRNLNDPNSKVPQAFSGGTVTYGRTWQLLAYQVSYSSGTTVVKLFRNDQTVGTFSVPGFVFIDYLGGSKVVYFILGAQYNGITYLDAFAGNIAQLSIYQGMNVTPTLRSGCGCAQCSSANTCLSNCLLSEADVQGVCQPCLSSCKYGCFRTTDCLLNVDPLCSVFAGPTSCTTCVPYATLANGKCACVENASASAAGNSCSCNAPYQSNAGVSCVACKKYFQASDVTAAFDAYLIKVYVTFAGKVDLAGFQNCASFIAAESLAKLGTAPTCVWNTESTVMTIVMGSGARLVQESLKLLPNYIFTRLDTTTCGYLPVDLTPLVKITGSPLPPKAVITAPRVFSLSCGNEDLFLSGESSTGGFSRGLNYTWTVSSSLTGSSPTIYTGATISLAKSTLTESKLSVALTVQNLFSLVDTTSVFVQLTSNPALDVQVSGGPQQTALRTSQAVLLRASFQSHCNLTGSPYYRWTFDSSNNADTSAARTALNTQDNLCYLSTSALAPDYYYVYNLTVTVGSATGYFPVNVTVAKPPLKVVVTPASGEFPATSELRLSAANSQDPAKLTGDIAYQWSCTESTGDCKAGDGSLLLPASARSSDLIIQASKLRLGATYQFTVTLTKDVRTGSATRSMTIVTGNGCSVDLPVTALRVPSEQALDVIPSVSATASASFSWSQVSGPGVVLQSATSLLHLPANALTAGASYTFRLSVTTTSAISAYFSVSVNWPPSGGVLTITPSSGIVLIDMFRLLASGWEDPDGTDYPLSYQFFSVNAGKVTLTSFDLSPEFHTKLGLGTTGAALKVCDSLKACKDASASVTVGKYLRFLQSQTQFQSDTLDPAKVPSMVAAYSTSMLLDEATLTVMLGELRDYCAAQPADATVLDIAHSGIGAMQAQTQLLRNMSAQWLNFEQSVLSRLDTISQSQFAQSLALFSKTQYDDLSEVQTVVETAAGMYLSGILPGQTAYTYNSQIYSLQAYRLLGSQLNSAIFATSRGKVSLPVNFTLEAGIADTTLVDLVFAHFNQTSEPSDLAWLRLWDSGVYENGALTLTTGSRITVPELTSPINFTIPAIIDNETSYDCIASGSCTIANTTSSTITLSVTSLDSIYIRVRPSVVPEPTPEVTVSEDCEVVSATQYYVPIGLLIALSGLCVILVAASLALDYLFTKKSEKQLEKKEEVKEQYRPVDLTGVVPPAAPSDVNVQVQDPPPNSERSEPQVKDAKRPCWKGVLV